MTRRGRLRLAVVVIAVIVAAARFVGLDSASHSVSDTLRPWSIEVLVILIAAAVAFAVIDQLLARRDRRS